ncbi:N-acetyltransferase [Luteimicrobium album]|uniref:N-acetyltransferase n=1 Tax=Luteimicrobium album TaxID=1054550 RepID=A0ABQ6I2M1_9MICO|nr:GNAT family N-acetyltransferase [Luteimicrobium album]GMA25018.1 N-acetyltransferase [Luteimicrobium album]
MTDARVVVSPVPDTEIDDVVAVLADAVGGTRSTVAVRAARIIRTTTNVRAYDDGRLAAVACVAVDPRATGRGVVELVGTDAELRGRGHARTVLESAACRLGLTELVAETDAEAVGFYRRCGFDVVSLGERYPGVERFRCRLGDRPPSN